tara:strand:+ start:820 stop:1053 length:234 start_codon:yes stop_codon:yes gene_type:complete
MKELVRSSDFIFMSHLKVCLLSEGIEVFELGSEVASLYPGVEEFAARLMVMDDDFMVASDILQSLEIKQIDEDLPNE